MRSTSRIRSFFASSRPSYTTSFQTGLFRRAFNEGLSDCLDSFFACGTLTTSDLLEEILQVDTVVIVWCDTPCKGWLARVGCLSVGYSGPFVNDVRLILALVDHGFNSHDPRLQPFLIPVEAMITVISAIARRLVAEAVVSGGPPVGRGRAKVLAWYRELRARIEQACGDRGVTAELEKRRGLLVEVVNAIVGARVRAGLERDGAKKVAAGMTEQEIKRQRSEAASEMRLRSVGGPRFEGPPVRFADVKHFFTQPQLAAVASHPPALALFEPAYTLNSSLPPRVKQLTDLIRDHKEALLDGTDSPAPALRGSVVGDTQYVMWFLSGRPGSEYRRSATQVGKVREQPERTAEEQAARTAGYRDRQLSQQAEKRRLAAKSNVGELPLVQALVDLAQDGYADATGHKSRSNVAAIECEACGDRFVAELGRLVHFCYVSQRRQERKGTDANIVRHRALYPAALIQFLRMEGVELEALLAEARLTPLNALSALTRCPELLACFPSQSDAIIYVHADTPVSLREHMAIDTKSSLLPRRASSSTLVRRKASRSRFGTVRMTWATFEIPSNSRVSSSAASCTLSPSRTMRCAAWRRRRRPRCCSCSNGRRTRRKDGGRDGESSTCIL